MKINGWYEINYGDTKYIIKVLSHSALHTRAEFFDYNTKNYICGHGAVTESFRNPVPCKALRKNKPKPKHNLKVITSCPRCGYVTYDVLNTSDVNNVYITNLYHKKHGPCCLDIKRLVVPYERQEIANDA